MSYALIGFYILITILVIIVAVLYTLAIDDLASLPSTDNTVVNAIISDVITIGSFTVILGIFLMALCIILTILAYYSSTTGQASSLLGYLNIAGWILTLSILILIIYNMNQLSAIILPPINTENYEKIVDSSRNYMWWSTLILLVIFIFLIIATFFT